MSVDIRQDILDLPRALRETLDKGRPEYERLVRHTRWGELPIHIIGSGAAHAVALAGAIAFESLCEWPVVVHTVAEFAAYSHATIQPRAVLIVVSEGHDPTETIEAMKAAQARGGIVLTLAGTSQSPLTQAADGTLPVSAGPDDDSAIRLPVCQHAALTYFALVTAHVLKRHRPQFDTLETEFGTLAEHVEWALTQLTPAVGSLASELARAENLLVIAGGGYYPAALQGARVLRRLAGVRSEGLNVAEWPAPSRGELGKEKTVLVVSGSRCRVKKEIHRWVEQARKAGVRILCLTDGNEVEVSRRSDLALLLPTQSELVGSILALTVLHWIAYHAIHVRTQNRRTQGR
jgi:glucosamine 6-phosphate synthetase-like amidotransferase/phosphosugar isomerase protein